MLETPDDIARLQTVLDVSHATGGSHLIEVITPERLLPAEELSRRLTGMRLLALATSTADGRPLVSPVDGIFCHGEFWFGTATGAVKVRHIRTRPDVSATHIEGENLAVTVHGTAVIEGTPAVLADTDFGGLARQIYGDGWLDWGDGAVYARIVPSRMFVFHMEGT